MDFVEKFFKEIAGCPVGSEGRSTGMQRAKSCGGLTMAVEPASVFACFAGRLWEGFHSDPSMVSSKASIFNTCPFNKIRKTPQRLGLQ